MFRRTITIALTLFVLSIGGLVSSASAQMVPRTEEVSSMVSEITVRPDGLIDVVERIDYFFTVPRHGIYRDLPTRYLNDAGERYRIPIEVRSVMVDGAPGRFKVIPERFGLRIQVGDPDATVSGPHLYEISYTASGALRYFSDHDELYWNATGNFWNVPLRRASAVVHMPADVAGDELTSQCYTGDAGSRRSDCVTGRQGNVLNVAANTNLTIVVGWPPGRVAVVLAGRERAWPAYLAYLLPAGVAVFLFRRWSRYGRDARGKGALVVQYDPPDKLPPAELGMLVRERADVKDVSATIVDLAVRGKLKIKELDAKGLLLVSKDFEFVPLVDWRTDPALSPYETEVLKALFNKGEPALLSVLKATYAFNERTPEIKRRIEEADVARGYFAKKPSSVRNTYIIIGVALLFFLWLFVPLTVVLGNEPFAVHFTIAWAACGALVIAFAPFMPSRTDAGVAAYEHAKGFCEYLKTAEKYRLEWQEKERIFEKYLPYAMALGVVAAWVKAFEGLSLPPPSWYEGSAWSPAAFNAAAFASGFGSFDSSLGSAIRSAPSHSSSGSGFSGGSSGGGGGGGGGGSW